jgi:hypothetical protein
VRKLILIAMHWSERRRKADAMVAARAILHPTWHETDIKSGVSKVRAK